MRDRATSTQPKRTTSHHETHKTNQHPIHTQQQTQQQIHTNTQIHKTDNTCTITPPPSYKLTSHNLEQNVCSQKQRKNEKTKKAPERRNSSYSHHILVLRGEHFGPDNGLPNSVFSLSLS